MGKLDRETPAFRAGGRRLDVPDFTWDAARGEAVGNQAPTPYRFKSK